MYVAVLGSTGMLGHEVESYLLSRGCDLICPAFRYPDDRLFDELRDVDVIINCVGLTSANSNVQQMYDVNTLLPLRLAAELSTNQHLIHASTDGVFSGRCGPYSVISETDPVDHYGWSKLLGEPPRSRGRVSVIRSSIIGLEYHRTETRSLLGWLMSKRGERILGYANHLWNGVTTLTWAEEAYKLCQTGHSGLVHLTCQESMSKFELLRIAADVFNISVDVQPTTADQSCDRRLVPTIVCTTIKEQLEIIARRSLLECP